MKSSLIPIKLYCEHMYYLNDLEIDTSDADKSQKEMLEKYLISLTSLTDFIEYDKEQYFNHIKSSPKTHILSMINKYSEIYNEPNIPWDKVIWKILFYTPMILNEYGNSKKQDIINVINLLPYTALTCTDKCAPHMILYLKNENNKIENNIDDKSKLKQWIYNFKTATKSNS
jgi:hypothetical protein